MSAHHRRNARQAEPLDWHALPVDEVLLALSADEQGLDSHDAAQRLRQQGLNHLTPPASNPAWKRLLLQFNNVLIYVLLLAAFISALLGQGTDSAVILGVVVLNALFGVIQEGKAEKALAAIRTLLHIRSSVLRNGQRQVIDAEQLVPGDLVLLEPGDRVPADLRLLEGLGLQVQESALTGESLSVDKDPAPVAMAAPLAERSCMLYAGTLITLGRGRGLVIATGDETEIGRIGRLLRQVDTLSTPLMRQMAQLSRLLTLLILLLSAFVYLFGWLWRHYPPNELFMAAVSIAVAAIPEGLPAIITITLAVGVQRMARRNAIIRRLPAVETLGAVSVICTDKTGTLTRNEMTAQTLWLPEGEVKVTGSGYQGEGDFLLADGKPVRSPVLQRLAEAATLCNDARFDRNAIPWTLHGDPTEGALLVLAAKAGVDLEQLTEQAPRRQEIPFESAHRYMATLNAFPDGQRLLLKGAPERVLAMCTSLWQPQDAPPAALIKEPWLAAVQTLAAQGQRVLALAEASFEGDALTEAALHECRLLGLVGLADPPREEARQAVQECRQAGIRVMMITGDHASTASAIGRQLGFGNELVTITGAKLDALPEHELQELAQRCDIVARASPEHKLRLVEALQARQHVVAMTGDGVNDAPALKRADVGIAMGMKGTEAAKEAAEMVLADDNFATIHHAVVEGRAVYDNLRKALVFALPTNGGQAMVLVTAIALGLALPITPLQILWINMVTAVSLSLTLAMEPPEAGLMHRSPRPYAEPLLSGRLILRVGVVSLLLALIALTSHEWSLSRHPDPALARTLAINALVAGEMLYLINCRALYQTTLSLQGWLGNPYAWLGIGLLALLQLAFTYWPLMHRLFGTASLPWHDWLWVGLCGLGLYGVVEWEKALERACWRARTK